MRPRISYKGHKTYEQFKELFGNHFTGAEPIREKLMSEEYKRVNPPENVPEVGRGFIVDKAPEHRLRKTEREDLEKK